MKNSHDVYIFGGGTCGLFAASILSLKKPNIKIALFEKEKSLGRKFLVAGKGGFNLTHNPKTINFHSIYTPSSIFKNLLEEFSANDTIDWLKTIGINTYIGTSNRVFPEKNIKPIDVLNAIKKSINDTTDIYLNHSLKKITKKSVEVINLSKFETYTLPIKKTIIGFGGKSWSKTGSDGNWVKEFESQNKIKVNPFTPSNAGIICSWPENILKLQGKPLKNIALTCNNHTIKGECMITSYGLEGNTVYTLNNEIKKSIHENKKAEVFLDLKPQLSLLEIKKRLNKKGNVTKLLKENLKLSKEQILFIKTYTSKETFTNIDKLSSNIKNISLTVNGIRGFNEAISSAGGVKLSEVNNHFEVNNHQNIYLVGEMLDWDAPTGGFLIQGCYSITYKACIDILNKI
jgi:uncharacterized flavoprotein (TIGR03862 family)